MNTVNEFLRHFGFDSAACEQMLGAINFRGFTQDGRATVLNQQVDGRAQCRVGADAGVAIRAAALQTNGDVFCAARLAFDLIGTWQHFFNEGNAFFNRQARTTRVLNVEHLKRIAFAQTAVRQPGFELIGLTAQAHHHHAPKVGVRGIACQGAL